MKNKNISQNLIAGIVLAVTTLSVSAADYSTQKKPPRAVEKPDFVILHISPVGGQPSKLGIQVKNQGNKDHLGGGVVTASYSGGTASVAMPQLKTGEQKFVFVAFRSALRPGDRIKAMADGNQQVPELDENNNVKHYTY